MRILIFGTVYADTEDKAQLASLWGLLHDSLNSDCDILLVDSASPYRIEEYNSPVFQLGDNIGHLARGGQDGWGRAFCTGLRYAMDRDYDYVAHIEGDSLCSMNVRQICKAMYDTDIYVMGVPVQGTKRSEKNWVETGLMFFDVDYLFSSSVISRYDWQNHHFKKYPQTPEYWLYKILGHDLAIASDWRTLRDDCNILTKDNVHHYDWITHTTPEIFNTFVDRCHVEA